MESDHGWQGLRICGPSNCRHQTVHTLRVIVYHHAIPSEYQNEQVREQETRLGSQVWKWSQVWGRSECAPLGGRQLLEGPRGQGWLLETTGSRDWLRKSLCVCVSVCNNPRPDAQASHWGDCVKDWLLKGSTVQVTVCLCICVCRGRTWGPVPALEVVCPGARN